MRIDVDGGGYRTAADSLIGANEIVGYAYQTLTGKLSGCAGMGGDDTSSEEFVADYDVAARELVGAMRDLVIAYGNLAAATDTSRSNHHAANSASGYRTSTSHEDDAPVRAMQVGIVTPPSALGSDTSDIPAMWGAVVDHMQGWAWPSADTGKLRNAAAAWRNAASAIDASVPRAEVAISSLDRQRSPEIPKATAAIAEVHGAATELATEFRTIATACEEYAEKVDSTKAAVRGILEDMAIELGLTVVGSAIVSAFTFGAGAAGGTALAATRLAIYAGRIIAALRAIKAIQAIVKLGSIAVKVTDIRWVLGRFRYLKRIKRRPDADLAKKADLPDRHKKLGEDRSDPEIPPRKDGKLPATGEPNSYGYDSDGVLLPYANSRPSYSKTQVNEVWENAKSSDGSVYVYDKSNVRHKVEWEPGQPRNGTWDMGHVEGQEYRKLRDQYLNHEISKDEFIRRYRDPHNYEVAHPGRNRSHVDEAP